MKKLLFTCLASLMIMSVAVVGATAAPPGGHGGGHGGGHAGHGAPAGHHGGAPAGHHHGGAPAVHHGGPHHRPPAPVYHHHRHYYRPYVGFNFVYDSYWDNYYRRYWYDDYMPVPPVYGGPHFMLGIGL